jgi:arsenate reductase
VTVIYGIPNCDKCRSARRWFDAAGIQYVFHDLRADGLSRTMVNGWLARAGVTTLINTRSTTWRRLSDSERQLLDQNAASLILQHPTLLKRPLIDDGSNVLVGYDETNWNKLFNRTHDC